MSPLQSEAAKEFGQPRPSLPPPDRKGQPGKFSIIQCSSSILPLHSSFVILTPCVLIVQIPGKSSPMMETFSAFSMVGVYETRKGLKFVHITSEKFAGKFTVLIFMDNRLDQTMCPLVVNLVFERLTELEAEEWKSFNDKLTDFKAIGAQVRLILPHRDDDLYGDANDAGGGRLHRQPCHCQDDAHELCIAQGGHPHHH